MHSASTINLQPLGMDESLYLFSKIAPRREQEKVHPNHEAIRREIVEMCKGFPLPIKTLGAMLHFKTEESLLLSIKGTLHEDINHGILPLF